MSTSNFVDIPYKMMKGYPYESNFYLSHLSPSLFNATMCLVQV